MNELEHAAEFRALLTHYQPSDAARQALSKIHLVLLVAISSSGRNTIINQLVKTGRYHFIVSDTTRNPRVNDGVLEQNGQQYWFRSENEMLDEIRQGEFLEAAVIHEQQVSGMSIRELTAAHEAHKIAINEVEVVGAAHVHQAKPDTDIIFIVPPNFDEWMRRLHGRGTLPPDEILRRLESACKELEEALEQDYYTFVVNDVFDEAVAQIDTIATGGTHDASKESAAREVARKLRQDTRAYLDQTA